MTKLVELGTCKKPHGIKGGFSLQLYNIDDSVLQDGVATYLIPIDESSSLKTEGQEFIIKSISIGQKTICYFEGITDRNEVEAMVPFKVMLDREAFPQLEEGQYYLSDLIGFTIVETKSGKEIGLVYEFSDNGAQTLLGFKTKSGKIVEYPFIDQFFPNVDIESKTISFDTPEYL